MIKALKEYNNEVMKPALRWTGRHWKGFLLYILLIYIAPALFVTWHNHKNFKETYESENEEES